ncbi:MAG: ribosome biogenesis factor YjgA [Thermodesulfobacteriota bacterium]|nr:ribosome biogenesis factor YjgA [Thermodesulfobacteriota bacterium]
MEETPEQPSEISRSARKRDAKAIEQLAHALVDLPDAEFSRLPASEDVLHELGKARATKGHGSRKRQLKFVAGVLRRDLDETGQLRAFVAGEHQQQRDETRLIHQLEKFRERLCAEETRQAAMDEVRGCLPGLDVIELKRLVNGYKGTQDKKNYRQIFRCLRDGSE